MDPLSIPIIFLLGGLTAMVSYVLTLRHKDEREERHPLWGVKYSTFLKISIFIITFIILSFVVILGGVIFVTLLSFFHG